MALNVSENNVVCEAAMIDQFLAAEQIKRTQFIYQQSKRHCFSVLSEVATNLLSNVFPANSNDTKFACVSRFY